MWGGVRDARAETLTWAQVKERAANRSPVALQARQAVRAAHADAAGAGRWPRANPSITGSVETGALFGHPDHRSFAVGIEQELDVVGVAVTAARAAEQKVTVAEKEAAVMRLEGLADTANAFFELDRAQRSLDVWVRLDEAYRRIATATASTTAAGETSDLDAILAEADSGGATADLSQAKTDLARAQAALAVLIGSMDPMSLRVFAPDVVPPPDVRMVAELVAAAVRHRPELPLWEARDREAQARRVFAERSALPQPAIGLGARYERFVEGRESLIGNSGALPGFRHENWVFEATLSIPLPLFDRNQAEKARAVADANTAREQLEVAARELPGAVVRAKVAADASWMVLSRFQAMEAKLASAFTLLEKGFAAGQVDLIRTLSGAERIARTRIRAIEARATYLKARAELGRAVGDEL
jgi:cobalt-zinc-cadmium efflux system outer membrane protein